MKFTLVAILLHCLSFGAMAQEKNEGSFLLDIGVGFDYYGFEKNDFLPGIQFTSGANWKYLSLGIDAGYYFFIQRNYETEDLKIYQQSNYARLGGDVGFKYDFTDKFRLGLKAGWHKMFWDSHKYESHNKVTGTKGGFYYKTDVRTQVQTYM